MTISIIVIPSVIHQGNDSRIPPVSHLFHFVHSGWVEGALPPTYLLSKDWWHAAQERSRCVISPKITTGVGEVSVGVTKWNPIPPPTSLPLCSIRDLLDSLRCTINMSEMTEVRNSNTKKKRKIVNIFTQKKYILLSLVEITFNGKLSWEFSRKQPTKILHYNKKIFPFKFRTKLKQI